MMKIGRSLEVELRGPSNRVTLGSLRLESWDQRDRARRALKFLGIYWGLALCSIVLPVAHFVLVPGFLLGGPIAAYFVYQKKERIAGGEGQCPECNSFLPLAQSHVHWPISDLCAQCQKEIKITLSAPN